MYENLQYKIWIDSWTINNPQIADRLVQSLYLL